MVDRRTDHQIHTLCTQPEEENSPVYSLTIEFFELVSPKELLVFKNQVKQVLKGQNIKDMDAAYTLVRDLLRVNALAAFNNNQATFDK
eukprot:11273540-Ditylum_brightwellii.AAC.3